MDVPEAESDQKRWLAERPEEVLASIPIEAGDTVVDFGCGGGTYALQAAEMVGDDGVVHALDCDRGRMKPVVSNSGGSLNAIHGDGTTEIPLDDESCDVGLLYDVMQHLDDRRDVMSEMLRVIRPDGILSVYPMHFDPQQIRAEVIGVGFRYRDDYAGLVLHFIRK